MKKKIIYGGEHYTKASMELRGEGDDCDFIDDLLYDGRFNNDIYCISILYDQCFDLNCESVESVSTMISSLELGRRENFWLSYYQSADLLKKLKGSPFEDLTEFERVYRNDRLHLLEYAKKIFRKVPEDVSSVSLLDIEKEIGYETIKNGQEAYEPVC